MPTVSGASPKTSARHGGSTFVGHLREPTSAVPSLDSTSYYRHTTENKAINLPKIVAMVDGIC
jgi:hypothetical protein